MTIPYFVAETLDDLMREVIEAILFHGIQIHPTKGAAKELSGVLLEIQNPRARLSRTETRGKPFSCLGELCWYLAKSNELQFISYYIPDYQRYAEEDRLFGGYGPRLFCKNDLDQVATIIDLLERKPDSRQAVIQLFDAADIAEDHKDIPCTCTLQFLIRQNVLHMITYMRSNDAYLGLPHDVFSFTSLQEIIARTLSVELGTYKHSVGSLHLYDKDKEAAETFLQEGWQSTIPMPAMPIGDPWPAINVLREAELTIRTQGALDVVLLQDLHPYWADLIRLLHIFRCWKEKDISKAKDLRSEMSSHVYTPFIDQKLRQTSAPVKKATHST